MALPPTPWLLFHFVCLFIYFLSNLFYSYLIIKVITIIKIIIPVIAVTMVIVIIIIIYTIIITALYKYRNSDSCCCFFVCLSFVFVVFCHYITF